MSCAKTAPRVSSKPSRWNFWNTSTAHGNKRPPSRSHEALSARSVIPARGCPRHLPQVSNTGKLQRMTTTSPCGLFVGLCTLDIAYLLDAYPPENTKTNAEACAFYAG